MSDDRKCIGVLGRLFGHKWMKRDYHALFPNCLRCGSPLRKVS